jgi:hypothetical protein
MTCKQCGESFPKNQPHDVFEMKRHKMTPADPEGMTYSDQLEDAGVFCSKKCLGDYVRSTEQSGIFDLSELRKKHGIEPRQK